MRIARDRRRRVRWTGAILVAFAMVLGLSANVLADSLTDVPITHHYVSAINDLASSQIMNSAGKSPIKFDPAGSITRLAG